MYGLLQLLVLGLWMKGLMKSEANMTHFTHLSLNLQNGCTATTVSEPSLFIALLYILSLLACGQFSTGLLKWHQVCVVPEDLWCNCKASRSVKYLASSWPVLLLLTTAQWWQLCIDYKINLLYLPSISPFSDLYFRLPLSILLALLLLRST